MRTKVCDICGMGPNGIEDERKYLCSRIPCPKCWKETERRLQEGGAKFALEQKKRIMDEIMAAIKGDK